MVELVFDSKPDYKWNEAEKIAGETDEDRTTENPNIYDIVRLIEYHFDGKKW